MFPKLSEWKAWSALERAGYIAQLAAALSLLPTIIFAWLGWRETRLARTEQRDFFIAEKAPNLMLTDAKYSWNLDKTGRALSIFIKNAGESPATDISVAIIKVGEPRPFVDTSDPSHFYNKQLRLPQWRVAKGQEVELALVGETELHKQLGWEPSSTRVFSLKNSLKNDEEVALLVLVIYRGLFNDKYSLMERIAVKRKRPPNHNISPTLKGG